MRIDDIFESVLYEMADVTGKKGPEEDKAAQEIANILKNDGAVKAAEKVQEIRKANGMNPIGSVPGSIKSLLSDTETEKLKNELQKLKPTGKKGPTRETGKRKSEERVAAASGEKLAGGRSAQSMFNTRKELAQKVTDEMEAVKRNKDMTKEEKEEALEKYKALGAGLAYAHMYGKGLLKHGKPDLTPAQIHEKLTQLAKLKLTQTEKEKYEKNIAQAALERKLDQEYKSEMKKSFEQKTGKDFDAELKRLEDSGALIRDPKDEEQNESFKEYKNPLIEEIRNISKI
ncbi:MAG: hypothetical protein ACOC3V_00970 [bacterium]